MTIKLSKTFALILAVALVMIGWLLAANGCNQSAQLTTARQQVDSAKAVVADIQQHYQVQCAKDSAAIAYLVRQVDSLKQGWTDSKTQIIARDKRITSLNADYRAARAQKDTITSLAKCDSLSNENDSLHTELWTAGRRVDSLLFVNDDLKNAQDTALAHCELALRQTQIAADFANEAADKIIKEDEKALRKVKTKGWLQTGLGVIIGYAIKAIL